MGVSLLRLSRYWKHGVLGRDGYRTGTGGIDRANICPVTSHHNPVLRIARIVMPSALSGFLSPVGIMAAADLWKSLPLCVRVDPELCPSALPLLWRTHTWRETRSTWERLKARPDSQAGSSECPGQRIWLKTHKEDLNLKLPKLSVSFFFSFFLAALSGFWDLSSPTRNWTRALGSDRVES